MDEKAVLNAFAFISAVVIIVYCTSII